MHHRRPHARFGCADHDKHAEPGEPGSHGAHFGRGRHRRGGGLRRFFAHGDLRLIILHLVAEKPRHGYEIIKAIEEKVAGAYSPSPGVIYPSLTHLEELDYVTVGAASDGGKKLHEITAQGRAYLEANRPALDAILARMAEASREQGSPAPQILWAMKNLERVLRLRLSRGPLSEEQVHAVAGALDAAAASVEQV